MRARLLKCGRLRKLPRSQAGAAAVELAAVLPILFALIFGIMELGRALWIQNSLQYAVEAGARCAALHSTVCDTDGEVRAHAALQVSQYNIPESSFVISAPACGKLVTASYQFRSLTAGFVDFSPMLSASSCHPMPPA